MKQWQETAQILVLTALFMVGSEVEASRFDKPIVGSVDQGSPAHGERGGGDRCLASGEDRSGDCGRPSRDSGSSPRRRRVQDRREGDPFVRRDSPDRGRLGGEGVSGDVACSGGLPSLLNFIALISLQIGLFNLIVPIPVLDSGQMMILAVEGIRREDLSMKVKEMLMQGGVAAILILIALVLYSDLSKTSLLGRFLPDL